MNFQQFCEWRDEKLFHLHLPAFNRLDSLNFHDSMQFCNNWNGNKIYSPKTLDAVIQSWLDVHIQNKNTAKWFYDQFYIEANQGLEKTLSVLFTRINDLNKEIWIPENMYPFCLEISNQNNIELNFKTFKTYPYIDFQSLDAAGKDAVILIQNPMVPFGRNLDLDSIARLKIWQSQSENRWIILDWAHSYQTYLKEYADSLLLDCKFIHLFSMAKSWLLKGPFGLIIGPRKFDGWWQNLNISPSKETYSLAQTALIDNPSMPLHQAKAFKRLWKDRLNTFDDQLNFIQKADHSTYFNPVKINHIDALKKFNVMLIPASVFGIKNENLSVATCLHDAN